jgi:hypothetical protein
MTPLTPRIARALATLDALDAPQLKTLRQNAARFGDEAADLIKAIDRRLEGLKPQLDMKAPRLDFARAVLRELDAWPEGAWAPSRELFLRAKAKHADTPFVVWMSQSGAREIGMTKALETVIHEFPGIERRKESAGRSARIWYRRTTASS